MAVISGIIGENILDWQMENNIKNYKQLEQTTRENQNKNIENNSENEKKNSNFKSCKKCNQFILSNQVTSSKYNDLYCTISCMKVRDK